jgi:type II secretory pathway pseudopilin PulG
MPAWLDGIMKTKRFLQAGGFSLVEILAIIAVMSVLSSIGFVTVSRSNATAKEVKLLSDVNSVNRSVQMYLANGGSLTGVSDADDVLAKLKTKADTTSANQMLAATGSFMDRRVVAVWQSSAEASTTQPRAVWSSSENRFTVASAGGVGIKEFRFDENIGTAATETRSTTKAAQDTGWVWGYATTNTSNQKAGVNPSIGVVPAAAAAAVQQGFTGGYWNIESPDGGVDVGYVFREAGYSSRLALVSLEGMGPDRYDLTTAAGRLAFMTELVRRAAQQDRAQVIIDASQGGAGSFEQEYYFRPGDTVAAVLIPNASFDTAYNQLLTNSTNSQTFPLTSLNMGVSQAPFYQGQIASLGNNGYAIEDIAGGGDADFDDMIFTADGLSAGQGASFREVDPETYYPDRLAALNRNYWDSPYNGGVSLQQALINAGIVVPDSPTTP